MVRAVRFVGVVPVTKAVKGTPRKRAARGDGEVVSTALDGATATSAPVGAVPGIPPEPEYVQTSGGSDGAGRGASAGPAGHTGPDVSEGSDVSESASIPESKPRPSVGRTCVSPSSIPQPRAYSRAELKAIVGKPRIKGQVPTLVRFRDSSQVPIMTVLVDIGEPLLREGWEYFHRAIPDSDPSDYLGEIYELTQTEVPRLWKVVAELRLNC